MAVQGVNVVDDSADIYHVSGHANRPDLERLHTILKPKALIPMHGEYRHLKEHADIANHKGIPSIIAANGTIVEIDDNGIRGEVNIIKYRPRKSVIAKISKEVSEKAVRDAEAVLMK